ncbi:MAG: metallophosphoesterase, partial [Eubacterium sp.]|nr:metallophosphoesterase [Eubacterium sp.]
MSILKRFFALTAVGTAIIYCESKRELKNIRKKYIRLCMGEKISKGKPVRLAFIADYHEAEDGRLNKTIYRLISNEGPDAIIVAGDMINGYKNENARPAVSLLRSLSDVAPVYMAPGNHEKKAELHVYENTELYDEFLRGILKTDDIHYLKNEYSTLCFEGKKINIYGLDMDLKYYKRGNLIPLSAEAVKEYLGEASDDYNILIAHNPEYFESYAEWGADLTLSGHFHGGL